MNSTKNSNLSLYAGQIYAKSQICSFIDDIIIVPDKKCRKGKKFMKVYDNEFYGKVTYNKKLAIWKRTIPIELFFNKKICSLDCYIEDTNFMYTQIKYNIDNFGTTLEQLPDSIIEIQKKNERRQRELFDKYLKEPKAMMELFENAIIKDFYEERKNLLEDEEYCISEFGAEITEKIRTAGTNEKILDMVHFKELTLGKKQIRIIGECEYYCVNFGVGIMLDGTIDVGAVDMIYR